jgi:hypothetical protein
MDHQPGPGTADTANDDRQPTDEAGSARDDERALEPAAVTWARAQLRERIQQVGAALSRTAQPADRQMHEIDRSPLADMEPEP